jgi:hypothetical protein
MHRRTRPAFSAPALLLLVATLGACSSETTRPLSRGEMRGELISPGGAVGAAVLELRGIRDVTAVSGRVFTELTGDVLRAVFILEEPGLLEFSARLTDVEGTPSATVIDVADGANATPTSLEGYHVRFSL